MAVWRDHLLPRIVDKACARRDLAEPRRRTLAGLSGDVVEIGFGSGHNLAYYPSEVDRVLAVEPSAVARRLAEPRVAGSGVTVEFVGLDGQDLPLPDDCADAAVSTFTLCTILDVARALKELGRVLRPGGRLHFLEHGLSADLKVAAWQHRLTPIQRRVCGGCHFDRPIAQLITDAGLRIVTLENSYLPGPKTPSYLYEGVAERPEVMSDDTLPRPTAGQRPDTPGRPDAPRPGRRTIADLLAQARIDLDRVPPDRLRAEQAAGALVVDIRPAEQRHRDGALPGALVIDRNVLEWRLDPASPDCIPQTNFDRRIIVVCNEGYSSTLAAATLRSLGLHNATDLEDGYQGWRRYCGHGD